MAIHYYEEQVSSGLKNKRALSAFIRNLVGEQKGMGSVHIGYIFCSDDYLLEKNRQFLDHDTYTDIITFDLSETESEMISEIYISVDRVADNASRLGTSYQEELHRVIFHGVLHLCGFKDKKKADQLQMRRMEELCLAQYFNK